MAMGRTMEFKLTKVQSVFKAKWAPVRVKKTRQIKNPESGGVGDRSKLNWQARQFKIRFRRPNSVLRLRRKAKRGPGRAACENPLRICNIW
jgi:hypothetical protein